MKFLKGFKILGFFIGLQAVPFSVDAQVQSCESFFLTGHTISRARYLVQTRGEKDLFLKNIFRVGDNQNPRFQGYDNLAVSKPFKVFGQTDETIDVKITSAAKKAFKKYEEDSRESSMRLVATVLYEPANQQRADVNPWAILISKIMPTASGKEIVLPVAAYSLERTSASSGEVLVRAIQSFSGLPF